MLLHVCKTKEELARKTAEEVARYIQENPGSLLCFAAGDTPLGMLAELVRMQAEDKIDLSSAYYVGLDEWAGIGYETAGSCAQVMADSFYTPAGIPPERMRVWDGHAADLQEECGRIRAWIAARGGIGLTVLGVGMNGHVGFNEPGTPWNLDCATVDLDQVTRQVGPKYFGGKPCPEKGMTVGVASLMGASRVLLMANGTAKAPILRRALMEEPSPAVPASCVQGHPRPDVFIDRALFAAL